MNVLQRPSLRGARCWPQVTSAPGAGTLCRRLLSARIKSNKENASGITEDVLARLKAAEEEAAMLRRELAAVQQGSAVPDIIEAKPKRVDSVDKRETVFDVTGKKDRAAWLSEGDVDFFTGGPRGDNAPAEAEDPEMQRVVQKRLVIGALLTAGLAAFALVPTESLRLKPPKPMYFYVVPLLRIKDLLGECKQVIEDADWSTLRIVLPRVLGVPNNARENLENVVALIDDVKTAEKAQQLSAEFIEYLDSIDYNKYFDAMPTRGGLTGAQNAQYSAFSGKALQAAQARLDAFLALVPAQVRADAQAQMLVY